MAGKEYLINIQIQDGSCIQQITVNVLVVDLSPCDNGGHLGRCRCGRVAGVKRVMMRLWTRSVYNLRSCAMLAKKSFFCSFQLQGKLPEYILRKRHVLSSLSCKMKLTTCEFLHEFNSS